MNKDAIIKLVNEQLWTKGEADVPQFKAGDTITVSYKIVEGNKERVQSFRGVVIQIKGSGKTKMFTIRKVSNGVGVERSTPRTYLLPARSDRQEGPHQGEAHDQRGQEIVRAVSKKKQEGSPSCFFVPAPESLRHPEQRSPYRRPSSTTCFDSNRSSGPEFRPGRGPRQPAVRTYRPAAPESPPGAGPFCRTIRQNRERQRAEPRNIGHPAMKCRCQYAARNPAFSERRVSRNSQPVLRITLRPECPC